LSAFSAPALSAKSCRRRVAAAWSTMSVCAPTARLDERLKLMKIEIHGTDPDGTPYRLNEFREGNAIHGGTQALRARAQRDAIVWHRIFSNDTIEVVEIEI
jgi:hypothetical protein